MRELWASSQTEPQFGRQAWASARDRFDVDQQTAQIASLYESVIGDK
jgi:hypothetical protein